MDGSISIGIELREESFTEALNRLRRTAQQTALSGLQTLVGSLNGVSEAFGRTASAGMAWSRVMTSAFSQASVGAAAAVPGLLSAGQNLAQAVIQGFSTGGFYTAGAQSALLVASGMSAQGGTLGARAKSLASVVGGAFSGGWYSVGYQISAGIASGVYGGSGAIRSAAVSAAQNALYWAKRALGIRSPSRVFREEVGRMIPAGIAQGITVGAREPQQALRRQSAALVQTARRDVIPAVTRQAGAIGGVRPVTGDREMKISLEAPLYVDGRELARATAKYTGQQLMWEAM